jgi:hypothetical protein
MFRVMFGAFTCLIGLATGAPAWVPTRVVRGSDDVLRVTFVPVDMALRSVEPARYPMFNDLLTATHVPGQQTLTISEMEDEMNGKSPDSGPGWFANAGEATQSYARPVPSGFVFHEARVGSTLAANSAFKSVLVLFSLLSIPRVCLPRYLQCFLRFRIRWCTLSAAQLRTFCASPSTCLATNGTHARVIGYYACLHRAIWC